MSEIQIQNVMTRLEEMFTQLEKSWPKTMEKILEEFRHESKNFYIYTFFKWNTHIIPASYIVYHQPRFTRPDAFPGTVLREVSPKEGWSKIVWCLPHLEGFKMYKAGKLFGDPVVDESIRKYLAGEFDNPEEEYKKV